MSGGDRILLGQSIVLDLLELPPRILDAYIRGKCAREMDQIQIDVFQTELSEFRSFEYKAPYERGRETNLGQAGSNGSLYIPSGILGSHKQLVPIQS